MGMCCTISSPFQEIAVRSQAVAILMFVLIEPRARKRILQLSTVELLLHNAEISNCHFALQVNSIKALTLIAECRAGRELLRGQLQRIKNIQSDNHLIQQHKDMLLSVVTKVV